MDYDFLTLATRRAMLARSLAVTAQLGSPRVHGAHPDARLAAACKRFNMFEKKKVAILDGRGGDDLAWLALSRFSAEQWSALEEACALRVATPDGNRARALMYSLWDSGGLSIRAREGGAIEDVVLDALCRDLAGAGS